MNQRKEKTYRSADEVEGGSRLVEEGSDGSDAVHHLSVDILVDGDIAVLDGLGGVGQRLGRELVVHDVVAVERELDLRGAGEGGKKGKVGEGDLHGIVRGEVFLKYCKRFRGELSTSLVEKKDYERII